MAPMMALDNIERNAMLCDFCHVSEMEYVVEVGKPEGILLSWCGHCDTSNITNNVTSVLDKAHKSMEGRPTGVSGTLSM